MPDLAPCGRRCHARLEEPDFAALSARLFWGAVGALTVILSEWWVGGLLVLVSASFAVGSLRFANWLAGVGSKCVL